MRMPLNILLDRRARRVSEKGDASRAARDHLNAIELAEQYGVSPSIMNDFLGRFAPDKVSKNSYKSDSDTMLFVHIPKTAGVSVGKSLQEAFDLFHGVPWDDIPRSFNQATRTATYIQSTEKKRQVIMGHFGWPELQVWRNHEIPLKCGTIFRNPLARIVSNYNYNRSAAHPDNKRFKARYHNLQSYAEKVPRDAQLTQALGLFDSFETALKKLTRHYTFLGVTECLAKSLQHLGCSHGLPRLPEHRENVGTPQIEGSVSSALQTLIDSRSRNDAKMHSLVMKLYNPEP